ncbi:uncharacterized protein LOC115624918 [Scaptodrosophila lebanonensis]|uniref:Uncharacterized protein LOC115624918 n=1 Tax=Drosophila lebanonensis TaxID=7225 RepID=A0A6J2TKF4_DROLE|nr:uncharacterized protein LOC115624918 [Scaptodrosophila lebanonensis]
MTTSTTVILISLALMVTAEPVRQRFTPRRGLARQEEAPIAPSPAPTGYPAAGITPEIPFDLPSSTDKPEATYLPPDNTYGPPEVVYGPPQSVGEVAPEITPEQPLQEDDVPPTVEEEEESLGDSKQKPDNDEDVPLALSDDGTVIAVSTTLDQPQNLARLYQRFPQARKRGQLPVPERLILMRGSRYSLRRQ